MFPFRRNGPKKRGKGGGGGAAVAATTTMAAAGDGSPGSAAELLPMMQPSTKALAQMLAGNTKTSGQLVHARSVLAQANRMVEERLPDRLPPAAREQFFEQLALLKLTIADAEEDGLGRRGARARPIRRPMDVDRLREVALRLGHRRAGTPGAAGAVCAATDESTTARNPADVPSGYALSRSRLSSDEPGGPDEARSAPARAASGCG